MEYLSKLLAFYREHETLLNFLFWVLLTAGLNTLLKKKTAEEWERWAMSKPLGAFFIEVLRAAGVDPAKITLAVQRYSARKVQKLPDDLFDRLPVSPALKEALRDPELRGFVERMVLSGGHLVEPKPHPVAPVPPTPPPPAG